MGATRRNAGGWAVRRATHIGRRRCFERRTPNATTYRGHGENYSRKRINCWERVHIIAWVIVGAVRRESTREELAEGRSKMRVDEGMVGRKAQ